MKLEEKQTEIVSEAEWLVARKDLLTREKEFSRQRDALSAARRKLPIRSKRNMSSKGRMVRKRWPISSMGAVN